MSDELVVVTGGSGFIGMHCILRLLEAGYRVRTTVRSLGREAEVRAMLKVGGVDTDRLAKDRLSFVEADLLEDAGWAEAVAGAAYVLHVASPFPAAEPESAMELIRPAREGALRVLAAARDAGVRRVVLTSSFAAIGYGQDPKETFDERDWTNPEAKELSAYVQSKTLAERAAWEFMAREGGAMELAVVNPVGVFGPVLGADSSTSILIISKLMEGAMPGVPKVIFGAVDVRDVAELHLLAMVRPEAKGERFLAVAGDFLSMAELSKVLKERLGASASKVPTWEIPNAMVQLAAMRDKAVKLILPELGKKKNATGEKAKRVLGWGPRTREDAIVATAESLIRLGLLKA